MAKKPRQFWRNTLLPSGQSHEEYLKENASRLTLEELATALGRDRSSVESKLFRMGLECAGRPTTLDVETEQTVEDIPIDSLLKAIKDRPRNLEELSEMFDRSRNTMRKALEQLEVRSYEITLTEAQQHVWSTKIPRIVAPPTILWDKDVGEIFLGITGDWHDASKGAQISARNRAIKEMYDDGVRDIIVAGDINAGRKVYKGQELDTVSEQSDDQIAITETYCPHYAGLRYHMVGGNHDYSTIKSGGHNALLALCKKREDFFYYGYDLATIHLTKDIDALVWHPSGSQAYAMSYRSQKMVEQVAFEQLMEVIKKNATPKVRYLFVGHWHGILMGFYKGPIFVCHPGCFEGQTNLSRRIGVFPELAATVIKGKITKDRHIIRDMTVRTLRFTEIIDDYLNYPIPRREEKEMEPLFQWTGRHEET